MKNVVGIDVAKEELVIYINGAYHTIVNDRKSLTQWMKKHRSLIETVDLFVYEATGGYEKILARFLRDNRLAFYRAHANHVRNYAKAMGILAKTDQIDAKVISEFGALKADSLKPQPTEQHEDLRALVDRREQLLEMKKQENNRLETLDNKVVIKEIRGHIRYLQNRIDNLEIAIKDYVSAHEELKNQVQLVESIPGIGIITAVSILVYLPETLTCDNKPLAALAGLAPMNKDSGKKQGKRKIRGGRSQIRRVLYMAALSAMRWNPVIKSFYDRLISNGKLFKVAITAAMRKLLTIARSVLVRGTAWENELNVSVQKA